MKQGCITKTKKKEEMDTSIRGDTTASVVDAHVKRLVNGIPDRRSCLKSKNL